MDPKPLVEDNHQGQEKEYINLYNGGGRGDTWTLPADLEKNPRASLVAHIRERFTGSVAVLDIGCGTGVNTKWIAEQDKASSWTGIDIVSPLVLGIKIPENNLRFNFTQGNVLDKNFRQSILDSDKKFEMIVDQGAALAEITDDALRAEYLKFVSDKLVVGGRFITLLMEGDGKHIIFPDGRVRQTYRDKDFRSPVVQDLFDIEESSIGSYSYMPEDEKHPEIKNPIGAKVGDKEQLTAVAFVLRKKALE